MATGKRYYWIKLKDNFMTSDTVDFIMSQKDGANYIVMYQMLCLKAINTDGSLSRQIGEIIVPFDEEKIQRDLKFFNIDTIRVGLSLFKKIGLVYEDNNGILQIVDFNNLVGSNTDYAIQKSMQRNKKTQEIECVDKGVDNVHIENRDKDIKILDIRDKDIKSVKNNIDYQQVVDMYNNTCVSFPKLKSLSDARKKSIKARLKIYSISDLQKVFEKAEDSKFLKGGNDRNWSATFDWMLKDSSIAKILDGNYDNKDFKQNKPSDDDYTRNQLAKIVSETKTEVIEGGIEFM